MSYVTAVIGGKSKGLADQVTIDLALGCRNACVGCYAKKSSQRGKNYDSVIEKIFNQEVFEQSVRAVKKKELHVGRVGKHCDPGDHLRSLNSALDCCTNADFKCVVVSKSIPFSNMLAGAINKGKHLLHISIGPHSEYAPPEEQRLQRATEYLRTEILTAIRWTEDVTLPMRELVRENIGNFPYILTPMRYASKLLLNYYEADLEKFEFYNGYYRPRTIHPDWSDYLVNVCGEINREERCCNCLLTQN